MIPSHTVAMPPRSATFKKAFIAHTDDHPPNEQQKLKGWIEHNGARYSKKITEDVTHYIVGRKTWDNYKNEPARKLEIRLLPLVLTELQ